MIAVLRRGWPHLRLFIWRVLSVGPMLRAAVDRRVKIDSELDHLAERAFSELRQAPLVRPSRDLAEAVKQRLQQRANDPSPFSSTDQAIKERD